MTKLFDIDDIDGADLRQKKRATPLPYVEFLVRALPALSSALFGLAAFTLFSADDLLDYAKIALITV